MGIGDMNNFTGGPATPHVGGTPSGDATTVWQQEDQFWRDSYAARPYVSADLHYRHYRPAYQYGVYAAHHYAGRDWNDIEPELERDWPHNRGETHLTWAEARAATRDAFDRVRSGEHAREREVTREPEEER